MSQIHRLWSSRHRQAVVVAGVMLAIVILLGGGLVVWSSARLHGASMDLDISQQGLADAQAVAEELAALQPDLERRETVSRGLRQSGFLEEVDRVAWAEEVSQAARGYHPLGYSTEVGTRTWLPLPDDVSTWYATRGLEPPSLHATDLALRINGLHEDELISFLQDALDSGAGVSRIEQCRLQRRVDGIGVDAECTLRRFGIGTPTLQAMASTQGVEVSP